MSPVKRRLVVAVTVLLVAAGAFFFRPGSGGKARMDRSATAARAPKGDAGDPSGAPVLPGGATTDASSAARSGVPASVEADFPLAAQLNAPNSSLARDLDIVRQIFEAWQSNFPRDGNPVGENADITAALMGDNRLELALIPKGHRAVNERGELCDRWGTPFRFHQLSGTRMEIRSAGPDRRFATEDDGVWTPP